MNQSFLAGTSQPSKQDFLDREVAEVYLLLDFLSGRSDRSLRPSEEERARSLLDERIRPDASGRTSEQEQLKWSRIEDDLADPTRLVFRTMQIKYPLQPDDKDFDANAAFLIRARDVLNTRAWPATGATIAFTAQVACREPARKRSSPSENADTGVGGRRFDFAELAYPFQRHEAEALARYIRNLTQVLVIFLVAALGCSAYIAWGKVMLDTTDAIRRDDGVVQSQLASARTTPANDPCKQVTGQPPVCARATEIEARFRVTGHHLASWELPLRLIPATSFMAPQQDAELNDRRATEWATAVVAVGGNYLLPSLYALLGSIAFVLRRHYDRLEASLLTARDRNANWIRLLLGVLIGASIGLVYSGSSAAQTPGILGAAVTLSTSAIAFLAGYGVEGVFKALDALITQVFRVNGGEKRPVAR